MFRSKKNLIFLIAVVLSLTVAGAFLSIYLNWGDPPQWEHNKKTWDEYDGKELKIEDSLCGKVTMVSIIRSYAYCIVDDSIKVKLHGFNNFQKPAEIVRVIEFGDSLIKERNSELYYLKHQGETFLYHISKQIH